MRSPTARAHGAAAVTLALAATPLTAAGGAAAAAEVPRPGAAGVGDPVYPGLGNGGYDVGSYDLDLTWLAESRTLDGVVRVTARATHALSRFDLDARGLDVREVRVNGAPASFARRGGELVVTPAQPLARGLDFGVAVRYAADPRRVAHGGFVPTADGFFLDLGPAGARTVFPCNDHPSDKAALSVRLTTPPGVVGVASGRPESSSLNPDGSTSATFRTSQPIATSRVQLAVGSFAVLDRGLHGTTVWRDVVPALRAADLLPLSLTADQIAWAQERIGAFPLDAYGILVPEGAGRAAGGLQPQTLTTYGTGGLTQPEAQIGPRMMGELVQSWFGSSVTPKDWSAQWLAGGHASFYADLYRFERGWADEAGHHSLDEKMRALYARGDAWRAQAGPVARPTAARLFDAQRREGAALVLYALLTKVGPEVFTKIERSFLQAYEGASAGTADFIDVAERSSGDATVRPFLVSWLYGTTTPAMPGNPDWARG